MIGLVKIGREANPYLEDMANREGIALTDTYYIFVELLQECLKEFEFDRQYIYREYARWIKSIEEELSLIHIWYKKENNRCFTTKLWNHGRNYCWAGYGELCLDQNKM